MIAAVRVDPAAYDTTDEKVITFERMLVSLNQSIMLGEVFKGCIEQNFEAVYDEESNSTIDAIAIRANGIFLAELLYCLRADFEGSIPWVDKTAELPEHRDGILSGFCLYALYRR